MGKPSVFTTRWFQGIIRKEGIADATLLEAVARAEHGQIDADLGGGVIKQRIARQDRASRAGIGRSLYFGTGIARCLCTASPKASEKTSESMKRRRLRQPRSTSWP